MSTIVQWLGRRRKAVQALAAVVLTWFTVVMAANGGQLGHVTDLQYLALAIGIAGVFGVHQVSNDPPPPPPAEPLPAEVRRTLALDAELRQGVAAGTEIPPGVGLVAGPGAPRGG